MRNRVLAASTVFGSAVFGILTLTACGTSTMAGSAYSGATVTTMSSASAAASTMASGSPMASGKAMPSAVLTVKKTKIGYVLANASGYTVYWFAKDPRGSSHPACTGSCLLLWHPVTGHAVAAKGVTLDAKLDCITRSAGMMQATYNGFPLYTFASDSAPGLTNGNGSGGVWHVIKFRGNA